MLASSKDDEDSMPESRKDGQIKCLFRTKKWRQLWTARQAWVKCTSVSDDHADACGYDSTGIARIFHHTHMTYAR